MDIAINNLNGIQNTNQKSSNKFQIDSSLTFGTQSSINKEKQSSVKRRRNIEILKSTDSASKGSTCCGSLPADVVRFPRLQQYAHFHYESSEFDSIKAVLDAINDEDELYSITVTVNKKSWLVRRAYDQIKSLDQQIHACLFAREVSHLMCLDDLIATSVEGMNKTVQDYLEKFTQLVAGRPITCGTVLSFFDVDNRGHRLVGADENNSDINIPAVAAAHVIKRYASQAPDELTLEVGEMVSVIEKPIAEESAWWRGKKNFEVGYFPAECVEIIEGRSKVVDTVDTKPVLRRRGKLITFLRMFFTHRPTRLSLKQNGIVKEQVFGCDLTEHLSNTSCTIPPVLKACCDAIELHGVVDGIYRLSGVASNIQRLRAEFDEGSIDVLDDDYLLDLHTITAVLKMYFRELPNPLMTYQLYDSFSDAIQYKGDERIERLKNTIAKLPQAHYRSAKYLFKHLNLMSQHHKLTGMDSRNLAIVWSPNLMRSKSLEAGGVSGATMLLNVSVQATVVEALISNFDSIFVEDIYLIQSEGGKKPRPSSMLINSPNRLLSLSEAQDRLSAESGNQSIRTPDSNGDVIPVFHTAIEFPDRRRSASTTESPSQGLNEQSEHKQFNKPFAFRSLLHRASKRNSTKKKQPNTDSSSITDITESEIGHLARRVNLSPKMDLHKSDSIKGSMPSLTDNFENNKDSNTLEVPVDEPSTMTRAASHESFFEAQSPTNPPVNAEPEAPQTIQSKTPGVVFRPAYNRQGLDDLLNSNIPKVTWKVSNVPTNPRTDTMSSKVLRLPALGMLTAEPTISSEGQGQDSLKRKPMAMPKMEDQQAAYREENIYETIGKYQGAIKPGNDKVTVQSSIPDAPDNIDSFMSKWEDNETIMCMNQAKQARISRNLSLNSNSSDRSRRVIADTPYQTDQNLDYENIDQIISKLSDVNRSPIKAELFDISNKHEREILSEELVKNSETEVFELKSKNIHQNLNLVKEQDSPQTPIVDYRPTHENIEAIAHPAVPQHMLSSDNLRPRSNSLQPFTTSPVQSRRKETDVDLALAVRTGEPVLPMQPKPSRKVPYVNVSSYRRYYDKKSASFDSDSSPRVVESDIVTEVDLSGGRTDNNNRPIDNPDLNNSSSKPPDVVPAFTRPIPPMRGKTPPLAAPRKPSISRDETDIKVTGNTRSSPSRSTGSVDSSKIDTGSEEELGASSATESKLSRPEPAPRKPHMLDLL